jgi:hypothetical protein
MGKFKSANSPVRLKILCAFLFGFINMANAQDSLLYGVFPVEDSKVVYSKVIHVPGVKKNELFGIVKDWMVDSYKSQKDALQSEDKEAGYLAYKGWSTLLGKYTAGLWKGQPYRFELWYTMKVYIKEEKVKLEITDLVKQTHLYYGGQDLGTKTRIEDFEKRIEGSSPKKLAKHRESQKEDNLLLNSQILSIYTSFEARLKSNKKSPFDF